MYYCKTCKKRFVPRKLKDIQLQDSIIRRIEIIGDAVKNIPQEIKKKYLEIPWKEIAGMRDILVHEYFGIDLQLTWETVQKDIPQLKNKLLKIENDIDFQDFWEANPRLFKGGIQPPPIVIQIQLIRAMGYANKKDR